MNVLDLFSGIGGFSLGLERAGMRTVAFCEVDPFCRAVLRKHWPDVPCYDDVRTLTVDRLRADGISADVICGGFPCQDISIAGAFYNGRKGIDGGDRSGLWSEFARIIGELRPRYAIVENVSALLGRDLGRVLGDLATLGFDAEWHCIPASAVGAAHRRDRIWIVAHPRGFRCQWLGAVQCAPIDGRAVIERLLQLAVRAGVSAGSRGRVHDGVPNRIHRNRALGNAVIPQIPEIIGRAIMRAK